MLKRKTQDQPAIIGVITEEANRAVLPDQFFY